MITLEQVQKFCWIASASMISWCMGKNDHDVAPYLLIAILLVFLTNLLKALK